MSRGIKMIDYIKITHGINHYKNWGYEPIDAPWFVSRKAMEVTSPPGRRFCSSFIGDLVASGEQSFIEMWMSGKLKPGKWQCTTPCFRDDKIDKLHHNYFFKVELIEVSPDDVENGIDDMIKAALTFFNKYVDDVRVVDTDIGKDIFTRDIELGSYGYREHKDFKWVYGTGVAEPRLTQSL